MTSWHSSIFRERAPAYLDCDVCRNVANGVPLTHMYKIRLWYLAIQLYHNIIYISLSVILTRIFRTLPREHWTPKAPTKCIENSVYVRVANRFCAHERFIWCLFPELQRNDGNKQQNNTRVSAEQFVTRVHTLFYLHGIRIHKWRRKWQSSHIDANKYVILGLLWCMDTSAPFLACPDTQSAGDVTIDCWWRHN